MKNKELKEFIYNNVYQNASNGYVLTPSELAFEMVSTLPQSVFESDKTTFLDPICKSGTFLFEIVEKLYSEGHSISNIQSRIYTVDSNSHSLNVAQSFIRKILNKESGSFKVDYKYDFVEKFYNRLISFISKGKYTTLEQFLSIIILDKKEKYLMELLKNSISDFIAQYEKVSKLESKLFGEVFTPRQLIDEMLDTLPENVWKNPDLKWLDPAVGIGNFPAAILDRLMVGLEEHLPDEESRRKHILENMLFMCDISIKNLFLLYMLFDKNNEYKLNVYRGSFLEEGFDKHMKEVWGLDGFDVGVGNPPYLKGIWVKFLKKILPFIDYAVIISPDGTKNLSKVSENLIKLLQENNIQSLTDHTKYFKVSSGNLVTYYFNKYLDTNIDAHVNDTINQIIIEKVIKKNIDKIESKLSNNRSKLFNAQEKRNEIDKEFSIKIIENVRKDGITYKFLSSSNLLNSNIITYDLSEWFITNRYLGKSNDPSVYVSNEMCSIGSNITVIKKWGEGSLDNFKKIYSSKLFRFVLDFLRNGMFDTSPRHLNMLPRIDLSKSWTDEELYDYFNLTQEEIDLIEKTIKD